MYFLMLSVYIPVYFPESLGCRDLKPIRPDLHPSFSRIRPMCSLCALPSERTAFSAPFFLTWRWKTPILLCREIPQPSVFLCEVVSVGDCPGLSSFNCLYIKATKQTSSVLLCQTALVSKRTSLCSLPSQRFSDPLEATLDRIGGQTVSLAVVLKPDYRCLRVNLSNCVWSDWEVACHFLPRSPAF